MAQAAKETRSLVLERVRLLLKSFVQKSVDETNWSENQIGSCKSLVLRALAWAQFMLMRFAGNLLRTLCTGKACNEGQTWRLVFRSHTWQTLVIWRLERSVSLRPETRTARASVGKLDEIATTSHAAVKVSAGWIGLRLWEDIAVTKVREFYSPLCSDSCTCAASATPYLSVPTSAMYSWHVVPNLATRD